MIIQEMESKLSIYRLEKSSINADRLSCNPVSADNPSLVIESDPNDQDSTQDGTVEEKASEEKQYDSG